MNNENNKLTYKKKVQKIKIKELKLCIDDGVRLSEEIEDDYIKYNIKRELKQIKMKLERYEVL
ncbi:MAG: hypothetical protein ACOCQR_03260 [bacterium]